MARPVESLRVGMFRRSRHEEDLMRVLALGVGGFIGSHRVDRLPRGTDHTVEDSEIAAPAR